MINLLNTFYLYTSMLDKTDIVFPKGNEKELIELSKKLGFTSIILCYNFFDKEFFKFISKEKGVKTALLVKNQTEAQRYKGKADYLVGVGERALFENKNVSFITNLENIDKKDSVHYRKSGLNQVLCKIAKEKKKTILINFNLLLNARDAGVVLGRMLQNVRFMEKYKVSYQVISGAQYWYEMRSRKDLESFKLFLKTSKT